MFIIYMLNKQHVFWKNHAALLWKTFNAFSFLACTKEQLWGVIITDLQVKQKRCLHEAAASDQVPHSYVTGLKVGLFSL